LTRALFSAASLAILEEACSAVLILGEGLERAEFLRSRLTRVEIRRQLQTAADCLQGLPASARSRLPELGWDGWDLTARSLAGGDGGDDAQWFALTSLVPATMMWLRVYRQEQPGLFAFTAQTD
jgi:hypothetical protein